MFSLLRKYYFITAERHAESRRSKEKPALAGLVLGR